MRRRKAVALLVALGALPRLGVAQAPARTYRVGVLFSGGSDTTKPHREAVREQLARHGFVEGRNLQMTWRGGSGIRQDDREAAQELVAARPDAILTSSSAMTQAAQWATRSVPIVFMHVSDPIADGIVKTYARPGGTTTGVATHHRELLAKRFELLRELLPTAKRVALVAPYSLVDPSYLASAATISEVSARLGFEVREVKMSLLREAEAMKPEAMVIFTTLGQRLTTMNLIDAANRLRIPSLFPDAESVELGGLMSYGTDPIDDTRLGADLLARVLNGAQPGNVPVHQNSRFVLAINLKSARTLGISVPLSLLQRADQVIR